MQLLIAVKKMLDNNSMEKSTICEYIQHLSMLQKQTKLALEYGLIIDFKVFHLKYYLKMQSVEHNVLYRMQKSIPLNQNSFNLTEEINSIASLKCFGIRSGTANN